MESAVKIVEIRTTFSSRSKASACGADLVARRLAACVQVDGPITSCYRWEGRVEVAEEFRCTCKTSANRATECAAAVLATHEYSTPELCIVETLTTPDYAAWVEASVGVESFKAGSS